jgi:YidC/Oxa1 family membrane protein insertase
MNRTQRRVMLLLPLCFVVFIVNFPAGLVLYWITTNTWTMGQQWAIRRIGPVERVAPATPGPPPRGRDSGSPRGKPKPKQPAAVGSATRARRGPPPPPPRNKNKRSGRRR